MELLKAMDARSFAQLHAYRRMSPEIPADVLARAVVSCHCLLFS